MSDEDLKAELESLRAELARVHNFQPAPEQINALPEKLRDYIHRLETITAVEALTEEVRSELDKVKPSRA